jgi:AcrR family transcriptional regulator
MVARLNRAQQQEHGYVEAKIDRIAEQADLTRGAVYSNFTGKRALYLAVLADDAERAGSDATPPAQSPGLSRTRSARSPGSGSNACRWPATPRRAVTAARLRPSVDIPVIGGFFGRHRLVETI